VNEQVWVSIVLWIFLLLVGFRFREYYILAFASVMGLILAILIMAQAWTLVGLGLIALNLYLMYESLSNW
jgi:hypothetical protein